MAMKVAAVLFLAALAVPALAADNSTTDNSTTAAGGNATTTAAVTTTTVAATTTAADGNGTVSTTASPTTGVNATAATTTVGNNTATTAAATTTVAATTAAGGTTAAGTTAAGTTAAVTTTAAGATVVKVKGKVALTGITKTQAQAMETEIITSIAHVAEAATSDVKVDGYTEVSGRRLTASGGVKVEYHVVVADSTAGAALADKMTQNSTATQFVAKLKTEAAKSSDPAVRDAVAGVSANFEAPQVATESAAATTTAAPGGNTTTAAGGAATTKPQDVISGAGAPMWLGSIVVSMVGAMVFFTL